MRIGPKVGLLVGGLLSAQVTVLGASGYLLTSEAQKYNQLMDAQRTELTIVGDLNKEYLEQSQAFRQLIIVGTPRAGVSSEQMAGSYAAQKDVFYTEAADPTALLSDSEGKFDARLTGALETFAAQHSAATNAQIEQLNKIRAGTYDPAQDQATFELDSQAQALIAAAVADTERWTQEAVKERRAVSSSILLWASGLSVAFIAVAAGLSWQLVRRIVNPIQRLAADARRAADEDLPTAVAGVRRSKAPVESPELHDIVSGTSGDELEFLAGAMNGLQHRALALAVEQRGAELAAADTLVNLGRRNQSLLNRTLSYVGQLERDESNPQVLSQLFRLDHLATRIRRNAESMLVLAGAEQPRTHGRPVPVTNVVRAALSEIEDFGRVDLEEMDHATVLGTVAPDLTHLLAELLENATRFSPESDRVRVAGQMREDGSYRLVVADRGLGMKTEDLAAANVKIAEADESKVSTKLLGLHIVGRLAARRDIAVSLVNGDHSGLVASIDIPATAFAVGAEAVAPKPATPTDEAPVVVSVRDEERAAQAVAEAVPAVDKVSTHDVVTDEVVTAEVVIDAVEATSDNGSSDAASADEASADEVPFDMTPADLAPAVEVPAVEVPVELTPAQSEPVDALADEVTHEPAPAQTSHARVSAVIPAQPSAPVQASGRRRVRGAQLPDLGTQAMPEVGPSRDAKAIGRQLSGLQSAVARAKQQISEHHDGD